MMPQKVHPKLFSLLLFLLSFGRHAFVAEDDSSLCAARSMKTSTTIAEAKELVQKAIVYLSKEQVKEDTDTPARDYAGNWPQFITPRRLENLYYFNSLGWWDVNPYTPTFIYHALTHINPSNQAKLGLSQEDLAAARRMRKLAIQCMLRFEAPKGQLDAGAFGFWPDFDNHPESPSQLLNAFLMLLLGGPDLGGNRFPLNLALFPDTLAVPSDADDTATIYSCLLDDKLLDGGPGRDNTDFSRFFVDWRDTGGIPLATVRNDQSAWKQASGVFLVWLNYQKSGAVFGNEVDLVVASNVLYALGRYGRLDTTGVQDTIKLINDAVDRGMHQTEEGVRSITEYYPNNLAFQAMVSRAYHEGGVSGLEPSVKTIVNDLLDTVIQHDDGTAHWDLGAPRLNTGFAILALLNAGAQEESTSGVVERAVRYLIRQQKNSAGGHYESDVFYIARTDTQVTIQFRSPSLVEAIAMEATSRWLLVQANEECSEVTGQQENVLPQQSIG